MSCSIGVGLLEDSRSRGSGLTLGLGLSLVHDDEIRLAKIFVFASDGSHELFDSSGLFDLGGDASDVFH